MSALQSPIARATAKDKTAAKSAAANAAAASFAALTAKLDYLSTEGLAQVRSAYKYADEAHLGQMRNNGEPYITHPIAVAAQCAEWKLDAQALMAALLHDVGKAIDPRDHVAAGLEALDGFITERTSWLIEHHMEAHGILDQTIGARAKRRLQQSESYEELLLLSRCDRQGRQCGVETSELDEALDYIRELATMFGE